MIAFTKRNLKLYLRDKAAVAFSLLAVVIVIVLYVLFLGDIYTNDLSDFSEAKEMMDSWVMAGVLAITSMTTTLGILGNLVHDREQNIVKDFNIAPVEKWNIAGGYLISSYLVGIVMSLLAFIFAEFYIVLNGGSILEWKAMINIILMILLTTFMNTAIMLFVVSILKTMSAFSTVTTIIGTLIGFLTGIYLPIGMLPNPVQWIIKLFPVSHAALVFRNIMMDSVMNRAFTEIPENIVSDIQTHLGIVYYFGREKLPIYGSIVFMLVIGILFFLIACRNIGKKKEK